MAFPSKQDAHEWNLTCFIWGQSMKEERPEGNLSVLLRVDENHLYHTSNGIFYALCDLPIFTSGNLSPLRWPVNIHGSHLHRAMADCCSLQLEVSVSQWHLNGNIHRAMKMEIASEEIIILNRLGICRICRVVGVLL